MRKAATLVILLGLAATATACGGGADADAAKPSLPATELSLVPPDGAKDVKPDEPLTARVAHGTLTALTVTGPDGKPAGGSLKDGVFTPEHGLAVDTQYKVRATAASEDGKETVSESAFRTLAPSKEQTETVDVLPANGTTVGVGQPLSLTFDHKVKNRAAIERLLKVTTDNGTEGSWGWLTETLTGKDRVDWRPKEYWKPGTRVTLEAPLSGVATGDGRYLTKSYTTSATIGPSQIAKVDITGHKLTLERDGRAVKTVPITAGDPAKTPTWSGKMPLMAKEGRIRMTAQSVGLSGYDQWVDKSMRLTVSGTFAHQAEWAESYIGSANRSHGCIGMKTADATWFYDQARIGDVFEVTGGKETVSPGNGFAEWNLPWEQWQKLSANSSPSGV
ncbi:Ig-like domain-containing protein [Streptomyces sp. TBY4]|uniref:L,D-transpeptidase family protein n=1 Tax=Streptomyces sp. TBY4 TaxID=2962030 RepID=UPI0020B70276|nr:Ig-like domain-containing protein [Streptomyces sp. TBY4]MCP3755679.1 Ig-like domain-containing protein [Streptomyces sp. TBY4]